MIDAGNTGVKIGVYSRDRLCRVLRADYETLPEVLEAGANVIVMGTAFFRAEDPSRLVKQVKGV